MTPETRDLGRGAYVRRLEQVAPEEAARWGHAAVPVVGDPDIKDDRPGVKVNRDEDWYAQFTAAGGTLVAWSWFVVDPATVREAIRFAHSVGAKWFRLNSELDGKSDPLAYERTMQVARAECDQLGMRLGHDSYGAPRYHGRFPWAAARKYADHGCPQLYGAGVDYRAEEFLKRHAEWRALGFSELVVGVGAFRKTFDGYQWISRDDYARQEALLPPGTPSTAWPHTNRAFPQHVVDTIADADARFRATWLAPGCSGCCCR